MTFNGKPIEHLKASLPGPDTCSCGAPMRADGSRCTSQRCGWRLITDVWRTSCCGRTGREIEADGHAEGCA